VQQASGHYHGENHSATQVLIACGSSVFALAFFTSLGHEQAAFSSMQQSMALLFQAIMVC
jgi:hypothetical protein